MTRPAGEEMGWLEKQWASMPWYARFWWRDVYGTFWLGLEYRMLHIRDWILDRPENWFSDNDIHRGYRGTRSKKPMEVPEDEDW